MDRALSATGAAMVLVEHRVAEWLPVVDRVVVLAPGGGISADGPPARVFAEHVDGLLAGGIWVPGVPARRRPPRHGPGPTMLTGQALGYAYPDTATAALTAVDLEVRAGETRRGHRPERRRQVHARPAARRSGRAEQRHAAGQCRPRRTGRRRPPHRWRARALAGRIGSVFQNPEHQFLTGRVVDELALGAASAGHGG